MLDEIARSMRSTKGVNAEPGRFGLNATGSSPSLRYSIVPGSRYS